MFHYFAYGSNTLTARLVTRCPRAIPVGRADAEDTVIEFTKPSIDSPGKPLFAGRRAAEPLVCCSGFRMWSFTCWMRARGVGRNTNGATRPRPHRRQRRNHPGGDVSRHVARPWTQPYDWYPALVIAGIREHMLGDDYPAALQRVDYTPDPNPSRGTRCEAIEALTEEGFAEWRKLLCAA